jgi:hypothetical protein
VQLDVGKAQKAGGKGAVFKVGQVPGVASTGDGTLWAFNRGDRAWQQDGSVSGGKGKGGREEAESLVQGPAVLQLDQDSGEVLRSWGAGVFALPHMITLDWDGDVWVTGGVKEEVPCSGHCQDLVTTPGARCCQRSSSTCRGACPARCCSIKLRLGHSSDANPCPSSYCLCPADVELHQALKFSQDGKLLLELGTRRREGKGPTKLCKPTQVAVARDGSVFVSGAPILSHARMLPACAFNSLPALPSHLAVGRHLSTRMLALLPFWADGYCNSRVAEFTANGTWVRDFELPQRAERQMEVPHRWAQKRGWQANHHAPLASWLGCLTL